LKQITRTPLYRFIAINYLFMNRESNINEENGKEKENRFQEKQNVI